MTKNVTLRVPRLYPHQQGFADRPERFKLGRWGRRAGKTVYAFTTAIMGHGPIGADGQPLHRGLRHGLDVIWVGRSKDQARGIWFGEVKPRFEAAGGSCNDTLMMATIGGDIGGDHGFGSLIVRSQDRDSINNARGLGGRIGGVVGDEVAHWDDAAGVWLDVVLPMLTDNLGWATFISTTEPGSWFNRQCADWGKGLLTKDWAHSHFTALDNPRISPEAFAALVAEYPEGDPRLAKEVYAELTMQGAGSAFVFRDDDVLLDLPLEKRMEMLKTATFFGAIDWGFVHPYSFGLYAVLGSESVVRIDGIKRRGRYPDEIADDVKGVLNRYGLGFGDLEYTVAGGDVAYVQRARGRGNKTVAEQWRDKGWLVKTARVDRTAKINAINLLRPALQRGQLQFLKNRDNLETIENLRERVVDPDDAETILKDDAVGDRGGDDKTDEVLYAYSSRTFAPKTTTKPAAKEVWHESVPAYHTTPPTTGLRYETPTQWEEA